MYRLPVSSNEQNGLGNADAMLISASSFWICLFNPGRIQLGLSMGAMTALAFVFFAIIGRVYCRSEGSPRDKIRSHSGMLFGRYFSGLSRTSAGGDSNSCTQWIQWANPLLQMFSMMRRPYTSSFTVRIHMRIRRLHLAQVYEWNRDSHGSYFPYRFYLLLKHETCSKITFTRFSWR